MKNRKRQFDSGSLHQFQMWISSAGRALDFDSRGRRFESCIHCQFDGGVSSIGRAPDCESGGWRFESATSPQYEGALDGADSITVGLPERSKGAACKAVVRRFESGTPLHSTEAQLDERMATNHEGADSSSAGGTNLSVAFRLQTGPFPLIVPTQARRFIHSTQISTTIA